MTDKSPVLALVSVFGCWLLCEHLLQRGKTGTNNRRSVLVEFYLPCNPAVMQHVKLAQHKLLLSKDDMLHRCKMHSRILQGLFPVMQLAAMQHLMGARLHG
jgi:hypothetical protein